MTNRYYNETFSAAIGSLGRSGGVDNEFVKIQQAFDLLMDEVDQIDATTGSLTSLSDFPASYEGQALKILRVNAAANAIEFVGAGNLVIKVIGGTSYTLLSSDAGALLLFTSDDPVTVTVPTLAASGILQGDVILIGQRGAGRVTLQAAGGVTLFSTDNLLSTRTQHAQIGVVSTGSDQWVVLGERNAPTLGFAALLGGNAFEGAQTVLPVTLTDGATINTNAALSNHFRVVLAGTGRTLANPTNLRDGGIYNWYIQQDGTGNRTITSYGSLFKWPGGTVPTLSTSANAIDSIVGQYLAGPNIIACSMTKDFR